MAVKRSSTARDIESTTHAKTRRQPPAVLLIAILAGCRIVQIWAALFSYLRRISCFTGMPADPSTDHRPRRSASRGIGSVTQGDRRGLTAGEALR
jgi:hypothetical protein